MEFRFLPQVKLQFFVMSLNGPFVETATIPLSQGLEHTYYLYLSVTFRLLFHFLICRSNVSPQSQMTLMPAFSAHTLLSSIFLQKHTYSTTTAFTKLLPYLSIFLSSSIRGTRFQPIKSRVCGLSLPYICHWHNSWHILGNSQYLLIE